MGTGTLCSVTVPGISIGSAFLHFFLKKNIFSYESRVEGKVRASDLGWDTHFPLESLANKPTTIVLISEALPFIEPAQTRPAPRNPGTRDLFSTIEVKILCS